MRETRRCAGLAKAKIRDTRNNGGVRIRIATWNVRRRRPAWDYVDERLSADIVLLQETVPPPERRKVVYRDGGIGANRPWGSVVAARYPVTMSRSAPGRYSPPAGAC